jgi:hypothetical protein
MRGMWRSPSARRANARLAIALLLCTMLGTSGCALLLPQSWRGRAPVPLAGPIPPSAIDGAVAGPLGNPAELSDARLSEIVEGDQQRLVEIASKTGDGPLATAEQEAELREIANRLPRFQHELASRDTTRSGSSRRPVIR